jgi:hypothetical protein
MAHHGSVRLKRDGMKSVRERVHRTNWMGRPTVPTVAALLRDAIEDQECRGQ